MITSFSDLSKTSDTLKLDDQKLKIYQTKIGNPNTIDNHSSVLVPERIVSLGALAPNGQEPITEDNESRKTSSQLLSTFMDHDMSFIPKTDLHRIPAMHVNSPDSGFLNPGITSIDSRKLNIHWSI